MKLTRENTGFVLDSTSDFAGAEQRLGRVRVVPLTVHFGDDSYRDGVDILPDAFYARLREAPELPTTSQPSPQDFLDAYAELAGCERIFSLHLSDALSGTYGSAEKAAAAEGSGRVRVVDSRSASLAVAMLALAIDRRLARGTTDEEIEELVDRFRRESSVVFTVDTLEYLQRGGRIGRAQALAGTLLNVKPILSVDHGAVVPVARVRGRRKALEEFRRMLVEGTEDRPGLRIAIAHADASDWVEALTALVGAARPAAEIELVSILGAVVGTHAGPGAVGFFWFQDEAG